MKTNQRSPGKEVRFLGRVGQGGTETKSDVRLHPCLARCARVSEKGQAFWELRQQTLLLPVQPVCGWFLLTLKSQAGHTLAHLSPSHS